MYLVTCRNKVIRVGIDEYIDDNSAMVRTILSKKDAKVSKWGAMSYQVKRSDMFKTENEAKKEAFIRALTK